MLARYFPRTRASLRGWAREAAVSRLYGGIDFRSDTTPGLELGKKVAAAAIAAYDAAPALKRRSKR